MGRGCSRHLNAKADVKMYFSTKNILQKKQECIFEIIYEDILESEKFFFGSGEVRHGYGGAQK